VIDRTTVPATSFRLVVPDVQAIGILNGAYWPVGVRIREWEFKPRITAPSAPFAINDAASQAPPSSGDDNWRVQASPKRRHSAGRSSPDLHRKFQRRPQGTDASTSVNDD
jgi:hypothetical protein